jgi:hypothetical protein
MDGSPICRRQLDDTSAMAKGISPDIEGLREVPEEFKARIDTRGEASLHGHLKTEGGRRARSGHYRAASRVARHASGPGSRTLFPRLPQRPYMPLSPAAPVPRGAIE